jgi:DNA-binding NarL/FixJ family response regulator
VANGTGMLRVLIVDDQTVLRQGLQALLTSIPGLHVVGTAENGEQAIECAQSLQPDLVLMDIQMPVMSGVTATQIMNQQFPDIKILILTSINDEDVLAQVLQAGAKGCLFKDVSTEELAISLRLVAHGYTLFSPGIFEKLLQRTPLLEKFPLQSLNRLRSTELERLPNMSLDNSPAPLHQADSLINPVPFAPKSTPIYQVKIMRVFVESCIAKSQKLESLKQGFDRIRQRLQGT